jgi:hypothetical protein
VGDVPLNSPTYQIGSWAAGDLGLVDSNGTAWGVTKTTGIFDGPDVRLNQSAFPNADGGQRSRNFRPPRTSTLSGWARGTSVIGTELSRRGFVSLLGGGGQSQLAITFLDGLVLTALIELAGAPKATPATGSEFDWQLTVSAIDPYLYGAATTYSTTLPNASGGLDWSTGGGLDWSTGGGLNWGTVGSTGLMTLVNSGGEESWPVFTIAPPTDGATLVNPIAVDTGRGYQLAWTGTLVLGDVVVIKTSPINRSVTKNGVPYRVNLTTAQFFSIPAQSSVTVQFQGTSSSQTALLSASLPAAY